MGVGSWNAERTKCRRSAFRQVTDLRMKRSGIRGGVKGRKLPDDDGKQTWIVCQLFAIWVNGKCFQKNV